MIRRICLYGGPGVGKTTIAAGLFRELNLHRGEDRRKLFNIDLVQEFVKGWAYEGRDPQSFDPVYLFAEQMHREDLLLRHVDHIVTDSPLLMSVVYAREAEFDPWMEIAQIALHFESKFPAINILLERSEEEIPYEGLGRFQSLEHAMELDREIESIVRTTVPADSIHGVKATDFQAILQLVIDQLQASLQEEPE